MSDAATRLSIKYGLRNTPSTDQIEKWVREVDRLKGQGLPPEVAGRQAAQATFPDFGQMIFSSEADTLETLLDLARRK